VSTVTLLMVPFATFVQFQLAFVDVKRTQFAEWSHNRTSFSTRGMASTTAGSSHAVPTPFATSEVVPSGLARLHTRMLASIVATRVHPPPPMSFSQYTGNADGAAAPFGSM
jgi:hypothetical protein